MNRGDRPRAGIRHQVAFIAATTTGAVAMATLAFSLVAAPWS